MSDIEASMSLMASNLIVVSNRLPFILKRNENGSLERFPSAGGLVTAVAPVLVKSGGFWVGWPALDLLEGDTIPEENAFNGNNEENNIKKCGTKHGIKSDQIIPVNLDKDGHDLYYNGCCNATFWPLFHSMPDKAIFQEDYWQLYKDVNMKFATKTMEAIRLMLNRNTKSGSQSIVPVVWIHDYQLMLAADYIRLACQKEGLKVKLSFFLHIPFPPWDIIKIFPWCSNILQGILACDLISFHIEDYCLNFLECCQRGLGCRIDRKRMLVEDTGRAVSIRALPIGIPFTRFEEMANLAPPVAIDDNIKVILGVDRLDYTKGLPMRLRSFEHFLEIHPELCEKVMLLQVAVPSRTDVEKYKDLKEEMDKLVGQINGRFSTPNWSPIRYICGYVSQEELAGFYRDADVALVTPLRDGMNLVAKEFVACRVKEPGVLILSPFAGAGGHMLEALLVNPYEITNVSRTIYRALEMPSDERQVRMNALRARERVNNVDHWMGTFFKHMIAMINEEEGSAEHLFKMLPVSVDDFDLYLAPYVGTGHILCLLLDYDGTLAPIASHPDLAIIPTETKEILMRLNKNPNVHITIISGRDVKNVKDIVGIEGITYAGSHGLNIIHSDGSTFDYPMPANGRQRAKELMKQMNEEVCRDGAWVEDKGYSLTYHYREVPIHLQATLVKRAKQIIGECGFKVGLAHCALECKQPNVMWNKGRASIYILKVGFGMDWSQRIRIIFAGDDITDEDAFTALKGIAFTFRVVSTHLTSTAADIRLPSTESVLTMLKWVEQHMAISSAAPNMNGH